MKTRQCSNVECNNIKNIKGDYCPDCGAEVLEYGFRDGTRLIGDKKKYHKTLKKSLEGGFLSCDKCSGYYELQPGESIDDFAEECECGGKLTYSESVEGIEDIKEAVKPTQEQEKPQKQPLTTGKPHTSPRGASKGNPMDWFNKQSGRSKTVMGLCGCCIGIILIIGISGMLSSDITTSSATYSGTAMSFQYPSSWTVSPGSGTTMVAIDKGDMEVGVELMSTSVQAEENAMISEDYYLVEEKSASGTYYKVYRTKSGIEVTVFLFEKNGKVFEVVGHSNNAVVMEKIVATIN